MFATLQFALPDEQESFTEALDGTAWHAAMLDVLDELRRRVKYADLPEHEVKTIEAVRSMIYAGLDDRGLTC